MLSCQLAIFCVACCASYMSALVGFWFRFIVKSGIDSFILRNDLQVTLSWLYCSIAHFHMTSRQAE